MRHRRRAGSRRRWPAAPVSCSPVKMTCLRSTTGAPRPTVNSSLPKGTGPAAGERGLRFRADVDQAHLERGRAAEDVLGARGVLHAGQLDHDAVGALLLDHRLGDAQLVDPVVQRGDVLLAARCRGPRARVCGLSVGDQLQVAAVGRFGDRQVGHGRRASTVARARAGLVVAEADLDAARPRARCRRGGRSCRAAAPRTSPVLLSRRLVSACFMSTCSRKCTPPRRSRPRYIGSARRLVQPVRRARQQVQRDHVDRIVGVRVQLAAERRPWP